MSGAQRDPGLSDAALGVEHGEALVGEPRGHNRGPERKLRCQEFFAVENLNSAPVSRDKPSHPRRNARGRHRFGGGGDVALCVRLRACRMRRTIPFLSGEFLGLAIERLEFGRIHELAVASEKIIGALTVHYFAPPIRMSFRSPMDFGLQTRASFPASRHRDATSAAARSPAPFASWSAMMVSVLIPDRTGNFAMIAVEPVAHMGLRPFDIAPSAVSRPSAICRRSWESRTMPAGPRPLALVTFWPSRRLPCQ